MRNANNTDEQYADTFHVTDLLKKKNIYIHTPYTIIYNVILRKEKI